MKQVLIVLLLLCNFCYAQSTFQPVAICLEGKGCEEAIIQLSRSRISQLSGKPGLFANAGKNALLVVDGCEVSVTDSLTIGQLHKQYGGKGTAPKKRYFNLEQYLREKGCLLCPNATKRISFRVSSPEFTGSSYFFSNLQKGEAYMPNAAYLKLYGPEAAGMTVDAFFRDYQYVNYVIDPEGRKYKMNMPIGLSMGAPGKNDFNNEKYFKENFRKTGKKKKFLNTPHDQVEYRGKGEEGLLHFWLAPAPGICLPVGKFDAMGFFNLGFIAVDGITYLVAAIEGNNFKAEITGYGEGSYQFNPSGYSSIPASF
ncbi:hypothetical protein [Pseudoflavitalea rhizosphaerae]|uniref:hypothetical protein n=1 Tax=Pseudoflavitalea rhizosphaerae TaxID=1884793 RepID=UPI000F8E105E|nr:hypothetical protein [Pseudoflavitalea rhizosphaerae]